MHWFIIFVTPFTTVNALNKKTFVLTGYYRWVGAERYYIFLQVMYKVLFMFKYQIKQF